MIAHFVFRHSASFADPLTIFIAFLQTPSKLVNIFLLMMHSELT